MAAQRPHVQKSRNELSLRTLATIKPSSGLAIKKQAPQPRRLVAEGVKGQQIDRNYQQHDATERQRDRRLLPGNRPFATNQLMGRGNPQRVERMIDRTNQAVVPVSSMDLLRLADVPQPVGNNWSRCDGAPSSRDRPSLPSRERFGLRVETASRQFPLISGRQPFGECSLPEGSCPLADL